MKLILTQDVKGLGKKDQIIEASDGYARNYLLPKKIAIQADNENMNKLQGRKDSAAHKKELEKQNANKIAEKLSKMTLKIKVKTGENGKLFGSITSKEISAELKNGYNIEVDKKKINLKEPIKEIGIFNIEIKLYEGITTKLKINIES
ncbi:MAG: 50S ribosomal protein L9 [Clostridia bacterium]|nr:50S ribosomal protein L9 [Clostridia bacterium]